MRPLSIRDLPGVLAQMRVPAHVRRQLLGDIQPGAYSSNDPNVGTYEDGGTDSSSLYYASTPGDGGAGGDPAMALVANTPADAPGFSAITWSVTNFRTTAAQGGGNVIPYNRNRCVLIVQNQHATDNMAVNFGMGAQILAIAIVGPPASTGYATTGLIVYPGGNLYVDRYCPTDAIYVRGLNDTNCAVVQGTRGPLVGG